MQKPSLYDHMTAKHKQELGDLTPAHDYFNKKYHKTAGKCTICHRETKFNEDTERYERFDRQVCRDKYREQFKARMTKKYGSVTALMNDPNHQKEMLEKRKISGKYKWSDENTVKYVGTYELDFLKYADTVLGLKSTDILAPAPQVFQYHYKGKDHQYIPDMYVVPYNLIVEIKGSNKFYRDRDISKEYAKDAQMKREKYNYIKILDKKYDKLNLLINDIKAADNDNRKGV